MSRSAVLCTPIPTGNESHPGTHTCSCICLVRLKEVFCLLHKPNQGRNQSRWVTRFFLRYVRLELLRFGLEAWGFFAVHEVVQVLCNQLEGVGSLLSVLLGLVVGSLVKQASKPTKHFVLLDDDLCIFEVVVELHRLVVERFHILRGDSAEDCRNCLPGFDKKVVDLDVHLVDGDSSSNVLVDEFVTNEDSKTIPFAHLLAHGGAEVLLQVVIGLRCHVRLVLGVKRLLVLADGFVERCFDLAHLRSSENWTWVGANRTLHTEDGQVGIATWVVKCFTGVLEGDVAGENVIVKGNTFWGFAVSFHFLEPITQVLVSGFVNQLGEATEEGSCDFFIEAHVPQAVVEQGNREPNLIASRLVVVVRNRAVDHVENNLVDGWSFAVVLGSDIDGFLGLHEPGVFEFQKPVVELVANGFGLDFLLVCISLVFQDISFDCPVRDSVLVFHSLRGLDNPRGGFPSWAGRERDNSGLKKRNFFISVDFVHVQVDSVRFEEVLTLELLVQTSEAVSVSTKRFHHRVNQRLRPIAGNGANPREVHVEEGGHSFDVLVQVFELLLAHAASFTQQKVVGSSSFWTFKFNLGSEGIDRFVDGIEG